MNILINIMMYVMWAVTLVAVLAATFTNFSYLDLNIIAVVLFVFTLVNTFFVASAGNRKNAAPPENKS